MTLQRYYDFGLTNLIRQLFANPSYCQARGEGRASDDSGYYGCEDAKRINQLTGGQLFDSKNSGYDLALDWAQVFTFAKWSQGLLMLRHVFGSFANLGCGLCWIRVPLAHAFYCHAKL